MFCKVCDGCKEIIEKKDNAYEIMIAPAKDEWDRGGNEFHLCYDCYKNYMPKFIQEKTDV